MITCRQPRALARRPHWRVHKETGAEVAFSVPSQSADSDGERRLTMKYLHVSSSCSSSSLLHKGSNLPNLAYKYKIKSKIS